jgi:hypothetical protein
LRLPRRQLRVARAGGGRGLTERTGSHPKVPPTTYMGRTDSIEQHPTTPEMLGVSARCATSIRGSQVRVLPGGQRAEWPLADRCHSSRRWPDPSHARTSPRGAGPRRGRTAGLLRRIFCAALSLGVTRRPEAGARGRGIQRTASIRSGAARRHFWATPKRQLRLLVVEVRQPCDATIGGELDDPWWVPEDIAAPPTTERVTPAPAIFTREEVDRVLRRCLETVIWASSWWPRVWVRVGVRGG